MTSITKNVYIDNLDDIVNEYQDRYPSSIKMEPVGARSSMCIDFYKENNKESPELDVGDNVSISKYKKKFAKV